jgi:hypothetical protein
MHRSQSDCGNRDDIVSYGKSSYTKCIVTMDTRETAFGYAAINTPYPNVSWDFGDIITPSPLWSTNAPLSGDGFCNDRGSSRYLVRTCPFGADSYDCGHQTLTLPKSKIPDRKPDDSCVTANNGLCEDQLYFSEVAPNDIGMSDRSLCTPNTE